MKEIEELTEDKIKDTATDVQNFIVKKSIELGKKQGWEEFREKLITELGKEKKFFEDMLEEYCGDEERGAIYGLQKAIDLIKSIK